MTFLVRPLVSVTTYRRWTFILGGTALLVPYLLIYAGLVQIMGDVHAGAARDVVDAFGMLLGYVIVSSAVAFIPAVRILSRTAAETLLGVRLPAETAEGTRSWHARRRTALWWVLHIGVGGATGFAAVFGLPMVLFLLQTPFAHRDSGRGFLGVRWDGLPPVLCVVLGLVAVPLIVYLGAGMGALLARAAPALLGPSAADRLAQLERRAESLLERNRLARELHDSVGHALTATTLQAGAALRVLRDDPAFVRRALSAIEETGRAALEDLDHVLGLLREDAAATAHRTAQRTLADLDALFEQTRSAGVEIRAEVGGTDGLPPVVSREAYRIVQEGLTNALRHAGRVPVTVRLGLRAARFELEMTNPAETGTAAPGGPGANGTGGPCGTGGSGHPARAGGGRGLRGVRERVTILGGRMTAGNDDGQWRVHVQIPVAPLGEHGER